MLYGRHGAKPAEEVFDKVKLYSPNYSGRMDHVRAAMLLSQLPDIEKNILRWNDLYQRLFVHFSNMRGVVIPARKQEEFYVGSSIQFQVEGLATNLIPVLVKNCLIRGVELKWFGDDEPKAFTSRYDSWKYFEEIPILKNTLKVLDKTLDMRVPLTFSVSDCDVIAKIISEEITGILKTSAAGKPRLL